MPANGPELVKRYERLKAERATFDARWEEMAKYIAPSRLGITAERAVGEKQTRGVYDSTTMMAAELMAHFVAGYVFNRAQTWLGYRMVNSDVDSIDEVREWLEECRDRSLKRLASSAFYSEGPEALIDWGGFGTGFLLVEEAPFLPGTRVNGFRGFYFNAEKTGRFVIQDGPDGLVDTAFREFVMTARAIAVQWPKGNLPEKVSHALQSGKVDETFKIIHAIVPRAERGALPWLSAWIEKDSKQVIHEGGYRRFPVVVPRYHRTPGEVYGRGRGDIAFPDAWTLNTAKRMGLEDWALKIRPPVLHRHDSVIGTLRLVPAGPTSVNTHGARIQDVIMPFATGSHPEVSSIKEEELRRSIREIFYVDSIRQLLEMHKSEMTAFEYAKKLELLFKLLGPVYGRIEWEFLYQLAAIIFDIQFEAGDFPPPPPAVLLSDGQIYVEFHNPIARSQKAGDAEALMLAIADLAPYGEINPQVWDHLDPDAVAPGILESRAVPAKWRRSAEEVAALRAERTRLIKSEQQLEEMKGVAEAAGKATPFVKALNERST